MPITDPLVVHWANERGRTISNKVTELKWAVDAYITDYASAGIAAAVVAAGASEIIVDGSAQDGRTPVYGTDLQKLIAAMAHSTTGLQQALNTVLVSGVGTSIASIADKWQTEGSPR